MEINKYFVIFSSSLLCFNGFCAEIDYNKLFNNNDLERISQAIYKAEGGNKTKYPFGIKSINTGGDYNKAKRICINTIKNNQIRWFNSGKTNSYLEFLGNRYCPPNAHSLNKNRIKNVKHFLDIPK